MVLTERDCELLRMVNACRALRTDQLEVLFFGSALHRPVPSGEAVPPRIPEPALPVGGVRCSGAQSGDLYAGEAGSASPGQPLRLRAGRPPSAQRRDAGWHLLEHLLAINSVRVAITMAARIPGFQLTNWLDETVFRAKPDYVQIQDRTDDSGRSRSSLTATSCCPRRAAMRASSSKSTGAPRN